MRTTARPDIIRPSTLQILHLSHHHKSVWNLSQSKLPPRPPSTSTKTSGDLQATSKSSGLPPATHSLKADQAIDMASVSAPQEAKPCFVTLPQEIRDMIYEHAYQPYVQRMRGKKAITYRCPPPSLHRVCRQLREDIDYLVSHDSLIEPESNLRDTFWQDSAPAKIRRPRTIYPSRVQSCLERCIPGNRTRQIPRNSARP